MPMTSLRSATAAKATKCVSNTVWVSRCTLDGRVDRVVVAAALETSLSKRGLPVVAVRLAVPVLPVRTDPPAMHTVSANLVIDEPAAYGYTRIRVVHTGVNKPADVMQVAIALTSLLSLRLGVAATWEPPEISNVVSTVRRGAIDTNRMAEARSDVCDKSPTFPGVHFRPHQLATLSGAEARKDSARVTAAMFPSGVVVITGGKRASTHHDACVLLDNMIREVAEEDADDGAAVDEDDGNPHRGALVV